MPKPTFHNLPDDKRERFVEAALDEFSRNPYDRASITAIVARLGIAKGSVYQYFDDKLDLFTWLVHEAGRRKVDALTVQTLDSGPFFERLRAMYAAGLVFWRTHPRWARLGLRVIEPSRDPRLEALRKAQAGAAHGWLKAQVLAAISAGELRSDLDADDAAHLIRGLLGTGLLEAWLGRAGLELSDLTEHPETAKQLDESDLQGAVDTALAILEHGLGR